MIKIVLHSLIFIILLGSCNSSNDSSRTLGKFRVEMDLFLPQFDCKTDTDDIHSIAAVRTILSHPRFSDVNYHAVAGAYGIQDGLYVPAEEVFQAAFGNKWSDAHSNYDKALKEVSLLATKVLRKGGDIWIAEAGQSDFSADLIRTIKSEIPEVDTKTRINIVQHSDWNENSATPMKLAYVKENSSYYKIPDGNVIGNGSPGFYSKEKVNWRIYISDSNLVNVWEKAIDTADKFNGKEGRHNNPAIASGGFDFSDVSETCWIFGFDKLKNAEEFFKEFSTSSRR